MRINLRQSMVDCLKSRPEERLTARQIAQWIFENHREACEEKRRSSKQNLADDTALVQQLVAEIATNRPGNFNIRPVPKAGGVLVTHFGWRAVFWVVVPASVAIMVLAVRVELGVRLGEAVGLAVRVEV